MGRVLIVDDDPMFVEVIRHRVERSGHVVTTALSLRGALAAAHEFEPGVVLLDVWLPDGRGLDIIKDLRNGAGSPEVIIITGEGDPDGAELAIKSGAWDYIKKGQSLSHYVLTLDRALRFQAERMARNDRLLLEAPGLIGGSQRFREALDEVARAASVDVPVLLTGETGTGKELFARAIHNNSERRRAPFVIVDCAALPEHLIESTLFGHVRGAFTGAVGAHKGLVAQAHGGSLFLDEVGELPLDIQRSFLRVLQERTYRPVGATEESSSDFRLIAATNRELNHEMTQGRFRADLAFRLQGCLIQVPPLRERGDDVLEIARLHLEKLGAQLGTGTKGTAPEVFEVLKSYHWPGNVRELLHTLYSAHTAALAHEMIYERHLPAHVRIARARRSVDGGAPKPAPATEGPARQTAASPQPERAAAAPCLPAPRELPPLKDFRAQAIEDAELRYLRLLRRAAGDDFGAMMRLSGLSRSRLYALMQKHRADDGP